VLSVPAVFADEHLRARGFFEPVAHPIAGVTDLEGPHWRMSVTPPHVRLPAPTFAQHNHYVFGTLLGLSDSEIAALEADGTAGATLDWSLHR
jgi:crotonobetainyl-CoA:carnitine CoA-transferase CaiB-like acyl-CoA transferase